MKQYRTIRHFKVSHLELREKLGIPLNQEIVEIDDRSKEILISTEELSVDSLKEY